MARRGHSLVTTLEAARVGVPTGQGRRVWRNARDVLLLLGVLVAVICCGNVAGRLRWAGSQAAAGAVSLVAFAAAALAQLVFTTDILKSLPEYEAATPEQIYNDIFLDLKVAVQSAADRLRTGANASRNSRTGVTAQARVVEMAAGSQTLLHGRSSERARHDQGVSAGVPLDGTASPSPYHMGQLSWSSSPGRMPIGSTSASPNDVSDGPPSSSSGGITSAPSCPSSYASMWTVKKCFAYPCVALFGGLFSGLLGIGGGLIYSPFFVYMSIDPVITVASAGVCVIFTATSTTTQYALLGRVRTPDVFLFAIVTLLASNLGIRLMHWVSARYGRKSYVILIVAVAAAISSALSLFKACAFF
eukprot:GHVT01082897.1.p1 GENE.GHVT01082897.1~~GHVT01082897.1.p1  ORF type:complete len:360 (+),score=65.50 GHVT01082897.1:725-1804(+)